MAQNQGSGQVTAQPELARERALPGKAKAKLPRRLPSPGSTIGARPKRAEQWIAKQKEILRREARARGDPIDEAAIDAQARYEFLSRTEEARFVTRHIRQARERLARSGGDVDDNTLLDDARRALLRQVASQASGRLPTPRDPVPVHELVSVAAIRRHRLWECVPRLLRNQVGGPPTSRRLMTAVFESMALLTRKPEIRLNWLDFTVNQLLHHWAFNYPCQHRRGERDGWSEDAVTEALAGVRERGPRDPVSGYRQVVNLKKKGVLDRVDSAELRVNNARAVMAIARRLQIRDLDVGVIDGTRIHLAREDRQSVSLEDEALISDLLLGDADFGYHEPDVAWRGWTLLILTVVIAGRRCALCWVLLPASRPEHQHVDNLMALAYRTWDEAVAAEVAAGEDPAALPRLVLEHVALDRAFDVKSVCFSLEHRWGAHPYASPRKRADRVDPKTDRLLDGPSFDAVGATLEELVDAAGYDGIPTCDDDSCTRLGRRMQYLQADDFVPARKRQELRIRLTRHLQAHPELADALDFEIQLSEETPALRIHREATDADHATVSLSPGQSLGELIDAGLARKPRIRFECPECGRHKTTYPSTDPRRHTWAPFRDVHKPMPGLGKDRYVLRAQMGALRNNGEGINGELRRRAFGLNGGHAPRWVKTQAQMQWLTDARLLAMTLRDLTKLDGSLEQTRSRADELGLLRPPEPVAGSLDDDG